MNGPSLEDCVTFDDTGRVCPGHRGSAKGTPPIDPATAPEEADVAARREKRRADKVAFRNEQAIAVAEALGKSSWRCPHFTTCGEWNLSFRTKCWKCSSKREEALAALQDWLLVLSFCRWCRGVAVLLLGRPLLWSARHLSCRFHPGFLPQGHPWLGGPLQDAAGAPQLADTFAYSCAVARAVRNRIMHALTGNGPSSAVWILSLVLAGPVFWDVHRNSRFIVDEAMSPVSSRRQDWAPRGPSRSRAMPWQWHPCCCARLPCGIWAGGSSTAWRPCLMEIPR